MWQSIKFFFRLDIGHNRVFGLDILRFVAITIVVYHHGLKFLPEIVTKISAPFLPEGVGLFFVLSGFLIGGILLKDFEKDLSFNSLLDFWKRRWFRTIPAYMLILIVLFFLEYFSARKLHLINYWQFLFFLQNFAWPIEPFFVESWSLTIEEWFYLLIPLLLYTTANKSINFKWQMLIIILFVGSLVFGIRVYRYFNLTEKSFQIWDYFFNRQVITRLDSILFGVLGAWIKKYYFQKIWNRNKKKLFFVGVALILVDHNFSKYHDPSLYILGFSIYGIGVLFLLPFLDSIKTYTSVLGKFITYISLISYSMYLINLSLVSQYLLEDYFTKINMMFKYIIYWTVTIILSLLLYKYYELPITKLRDRKLVK